MLSWFQALMPKEERFFDYFDKHAQLSSEAAQALRALLAGGDAVSLNGARVIDLEDQADQVTRDVLLAVRRTFITPFDRGDIRELVTSMDDAIDQMRQTVKAISLFEVTSFEPEMQQMGDLIVDSAKLTIEAVRRLKTMRQDAAKLAAISARITRLEEESDELHDIGLKGLFKRHGDSSPMSYIVGSEIYGHLEKVVDRFEDVADRVNGIVIEHL
jgi:predicted phosphate transport protein (TIGR00153 family)